MGFSIPISFYDSKKSPQEQLLERVWKEGRIQT